MRVVLQKEGNFCPIKSVLSKQKLKALDKLNARIAIYTTSDSLVW